MSNLNQILDSLHRNRDDKKKTLNHAYELHSKWLQNELFLIRKLIEDSNCKEAEDIHPENSVAEKQMPSKKRKSPEMAIDAEKLKLSPEQKRTSVDIEEILEKECLPADLNKLKKEQLIEELNKRGMEQFTMKHLKKDLIDALKTIILNQNKLNLQASEEKSESDILSVQQCSFDLQPGRSGSLMSEFRKIVSTQLHDINDNEMESKSKIEAEFKVRQERHRESLAKRTHEETPSDAQVQLESEASRVHESEDETENIDENIQSTATIILSETNASETLSNNETPSESNVLVSSLDSNSLLESKEVVDTDKATHVVESDIIVAVIEDSQIKLEIEVNTLSQDQCSLPVKEEEEKPLQEPTNFAPSSCSNPSVTESELSKDNLPVTTQVSKKPGNLVGLASGQSSFIEKHAPSRPVVAALEKAKQLKLAEEMKLLNKKKEQEAKAMQLKSNLPNSSSSGSSKAPTSPFDKMRKAILPPKPQNSEGTSKKGILGFLGVGTSKKVQGVTEGNVAQKVASFDVRAVETKKNSQIVSSSNSSVSTLENCEKDNQQGPLVEPKLGAVANEELIINSVSNKQGEVPLTVTPSKATMISIVKNYQAALNDSKPPTDMQGSIDRPENADCIVHADAKDHGVVATISKQVEEVVTYMPQTATSVEEKLETEYQIVDRPSDDESGSGTDDENESSKKKQTIPDWARGDLLKDALERQYGLNGHTPMDPDLIFPEVQSCSLEEIFGRKEGLTRKYNNRTSSAHWDADELTLVEKRQYRAHMGYEGSSSKLVGQK